MPVTIKSAREIELMAEAGRILEIVHNELRDALHAGMKRLYAVMTVFLPF